MTHNPSPSHELAILDATAQAELVRGGHLSAIELVEAAIARLERVDPQLNAVVRRDFARARARAANVRPAQQPFAGVPILLKDTGAGEAGEPCYAGMRFLKEHDYRDTSTSYFLQKLLGAGFVPLGRTNMPELAILATSEPDSYGPTKNPWDLTRSAGGSSGGSAAAVAAGIVPLAHASDGGGSIRGPASVCGLVGLKPSRGRLSWGPDRGERWSGLSTEFVLTRSVRDCAALLDVLAGPMPGDPYHAAPPEQPFASRCAQRAPRLRIAVLAHGPRGLPLAPENEHATRQAAAQLRALGHRVDEACPPALEEPEAPLLFVQVVAMNVARALDSYGQKVGKPIEAKDVEVLTHALAELGRSMTATAALEVIERVHAFGRRLVAFFRDYDLLLTPTQAAPPPLLGELSSTPDEPFRALLRSAPYGVFTLPFNLSGQPAISLPTGFTQDGLPIGTQLIAEYGREDRLLQVAAELEQACPWSARRPAVFG